MTLHQAHHLRGCVGNTETSTGIGIQAARMAIAAGTEDSRFPPVEPDELTQLNLEISVLSPPQKVKTIEEIIPGRHGVVIQKGKRRGLFLPQVWEESGWDRERFLKELAVNKTGLDTHFLHDPQVEWFVFEVDAFEGRV